MPRILFVTGKLAEPALRRLLAELAPKAGFDYVLAVLPITVAALAPTSWIARHLTLSEPIDRVVLPGLCPGDLEPLTSRWPRLVIERGPNDLRDLPEHFGQGASKREGYGPYDVAILAEINHAPRLARADLLTRAKKAQADGADLIDLGCDPGAEWSEVGEVVAMLCSEGLRISIDTFSCAEAAAAAKAGAQLVLSVNRTNRAAARDWGCEVVVVPDEPSTLGGLEETMEYLETHRVPFRADPILEPIAFGFANSLGRYLDVRRRFPNVEILMGVGNLTELTDVDSAGVNVVLLGFCQELGIRSVLTTEVVTWCRSCVKELDLARRLMHHACSRSMLPKHLEPGLHLLRDAKLRAHGEEALAQLAKQITDKNIRLFAERGELHAMKAQTHVRGTDPFTIFEEISRRNEIDGSHAFYLGWEMAKAALALQLGKNYVQDQALEWGFLTRAETSHRAAKPKISEK